VQGAECGVDLTWLGAVHRRSRCASCQMTTGATSTSTGPLTAPRSAESSQRHATLHPTPPLKQPALIISLQRRSLLLLEGSDISERLRLQFGEGMGMAKRRIPLYKSTNIQK